MGWTPVNSTILQEPQQGYDYSPIYHRLGHLSCWCIGMSGCLVAHDPFPWPGFSAALAPDDRRLCSVDTRHIDSGHGVSRSRSADLLFRWSLTRIRSHVAYSTCRTGQLADCNTPGGACRPVHLPSERQPQHGTTEKYQPFSPETRSASPLMRSWQRVLLPRSLSIQGCY